MTYIEIWSPNKYSGNGGYKKSIVVVHTNEAGPYGYHKFPGTAESLGLYLKRPDVQASYQKAVDRNGDVCRMVSDEDRAWAAGSIGNNEGLHICALGWSAQSREEWFDFPQQLDQIGKEIAQWCRDEGIPADKLDAAQLVDAKPGVAGHGDVAQAWHETDHTDPGQGFPYDYVLGVARRELGIGEEEMGAGDEVVTQFMGPERKGWKELAPQRDQEGKAFSIFKFMNGLNANVESQTVVEALATLVFEATLRIKAYRGNNVPQVPETVLGHAAAAHGIGLDNQAILIALAEAHQDLCTQIKANRSEKLDDIIETYYSYDRNKPTPVTALDPQWAPPSQG